MHASPLGRFRAHMTPMNPIMSIFLVRSFRIDSMNASKHIDNPITKHLNMGSSLDARGGLRIPLIARRSLLVALSLARCSRRSVDHIYCIAYVRY